MKLKPKLTLAVSVLVAAVVIAVNLVYLANLVQQQTEQAYDHADFLNREIYNELNQEMRAAFAAGELKGDATAALRGFIDSRAASPALGNLFSSAIGYPVSSGVREVALLSPDGRIVMDSNPALVGQFSPARPLLAAVVHSGPWTRFSRILLGQERIYHVALDLQVGGRAAASIVVGVDTVLLRQALLQRIRDLTLSGGLIVLLATILALGLAEMLLTPLSAISSQLDRLAATAPPPAPGPADPDVGQRRDEFGAVSSKIQRLGRQFEDVRQVYTTLQENVTHVLESLHEGLMLFDGAGICLMASAATPRLLGLPAEGCVGRPVGVLFPGATGLDRAVRLAVTERLPLSPREVERHPGGRPLLIRLDPVPDRAGHAGGLLTVRDAEPVHRLENELEVARRLSAVGRLTRGVAHEVKNPLNAMAIHLNLLQEKTGSGSAGLTPHIEIIRREIERLDRVVRTFLDFSRPVELQPSVTDLSALVPA